MGRRQEPGDDFRRERGLDQCQPPPPLPQLGRPLPPRRDGEHDGRVPVLAPHLAHQRRHPIATSIAERLEGMNGTNFFENFRCYSMLRSVPPEKFAANITAALGCEAGDLTCLQSQPAAAVWAAGAQVCLSTLYSLCCILIRSPRTPIPGCLCRTPSTRQTPSCQARPWTSWRLVGGVRVALNIDPTNRLASSTLTSR